MTPAEIQRHTEAINALSHYEMCRLWRFSKPGECPYFDTSGPLWPIFEARYRAFGGMTPQISKSLGWDGQS